MVSDRLTCEDIIQNTFIKLFENLKNIRVKESIQYWLFTTVRNEIYTHYRHKKIRLDQYYAEDADEIDVLSDSNIEFDYEKAELKEMIMEQLDKLAIEQRDVFLLKEYAGLCYKEIAEVMNIDEELVKSRLFKVRQRLIRNLSKILTR